MAADGRILDPSTLGDHIDRLFRAAWALSGSRADAEDLVQETFALVLAKPRRVRNENDIGYLLSVLRNTFISSRRAAARRLSPEALAEGFEPVDPSSATRPDLAAEAREVFAAIAGLPEPFRDALVAVDVVGLSYAEAADSSAPRRRQSPRGFFGPVPRSRAGWNRPQKASNQVETEFTCATKTTPH